MGRKGNFALVQLKPQARQKCGGHKHVAIFLRRLSTGPGQKQMHMSNAMDCLMVEKKMKELVTAHASKEVLQFIH